jgi:uncharacterized membrane protein/protein-disulfide isomerase
MKESHTTREVALRILLLLGLGASVFLLREYLAPFSLMCGEGGGCDQVKSSSFAQLLGLPTPVFGVLYFVVALLLCHWMAAWRWLKVWSLFGALVAAGFIGLQFFVIEALCKYCMIADVSALLAFGLVLLRNSPPKSSLSSLGLTVAGAALVLVISLSWNPTDDVSAPLEEFTSSTIPMPLASLQQPGKVTIIEFLEFDCDDCRSRNEELRALLSQYDNTKLNLVQKILPNDSQQSQAQALCCATQLGFGEQMFAALFSTPGLSALDAEALAASFGADPVSYRDCVDGWGHELLKRNTDDAKSLGVAHLPSIWINTEQLQDNFTTEELQRCLDRAFSAL